LGLDVVPGISGAGRGLEAKRGTSSSHGPPLEISSSNARVAALQKRWDCLPAEPDLILDQRGRIRPICPGGASGLLVRGYKGKEADRLVTRTDPGVVSLAANLLDHERQAAEELGQWKHIIEERKTADARLLYRSARVVTSAAASSRWRAPKTNPAGPRIGN
jgi:hypothetical protein